MSSGSLRVMRRCRAVIPHILAILFILSKQVPQFRPSETALCRDAKDSSLRWYEWEVVKDIETHGIAVDRCGVKMPRRREGPTPLRR